MSWNREVKAEDLQPALRRFRRYLMDIGLRASTIESYVFRAGKYLESARAEEPTFEDAANFREILVGRDLSISTINNYCFAIKSYHEMRGESFEFPFIKPRDIIPYFFDEQDVLRIFGVCRNIKHLAMLQTLFYACLRAGELCDLDDSDLDLKTLSIRIREGKGGKEAITYISNECAQVLKQYLNVRPSLEIEGRKPLFYTDFGKLWDRRDVYRMFVTYKRLAGGREAWWRPCVLTS
jgi:integrase